MGRYEGDMRAMRSTDGWDNNQFIETENSVII